jgi:hypothetical protein
MTYRPHVPASFRFREPEGPRPSRALSGFLACLRVLGFTVGLIGAALLAFFLVILCVLCLPPRRP